MQDRIKKLEALVSTLEQETSIQDQIIENYKKMVDNYEQKVEILEELLRRGHNKNEALAQGSDRLSSATAADSSVEGAVSNSGVASEGSHT